MKIKNNKGITLISLVITVIILAIIACVTVSIGVNIASQAKFDNIHTYLLLIQSKCDILSNDVVIGEINEDELYGVEQTSGEYSGWYKLSQSELDDIGVKDAKEEDGYYVNYNTNDVAYEKGVEKDGNIFHKLTEIQKHIGE